MFRKILVADDGSDGARRALELGAGIAACCQADLHSVTVEEERRVPDAGDRLPHVLVDVGERLDCKRRGHPGRLLQFGAEAVVGDQLQATIGVVDEQDLLRVEAPLRNRERADHVVGDDAAGVAQDVRLAVLEAERGEDVESRVHARDDREAQRWVHVQMAAVVAGCERAVVQKQVVCHIHGATFYVTSRTRRIRNRSLGPWM